MSFLYKFDIRPVIFSPNVTLAGGCSQLAPSSNPRTEVEVAHFRPMPAGAATSIGTMNTLTHGMGADQLLQATTTSNQPVEIHKDAYKAKSLNMAERDSVSIPAKGKLPLTEKGYHLLLVNPRKSLTAGGVVKATFTFAKAGDVVVGFSVTSQTFLIQAELAEEKEQPEYLV